MQMKCYLNRQVSDRCDNIFCKFKFIGMTGFKKYTKTVDLYYWEGGGGEALIRNLGVHEENYCKFIFLCNLINEVNLSWDINKIIYFSCVTF